MPHAVNLAARPREPPASRIAALEKRTGDGLKLQVRCRAPGPWCSQQPLTQQATAPVKPPIHQPMVRLHTELDIADPSLRVWLGALSNSSMRISSFRAHPQQPPPPPFVGVSLRKRAVPTAAKPAATAASLATRFRVEVLGRTDFFDFAGRLDFVVLLVFELAPARFKLVST